MTRMLAVLKARNIEFFRDVSALGWNLIFPFVLVFAFAIIFSGDNEDIYKVGYIKQKELHPAFLDTKYVQFIQLHNLESAIEKVRHHKIDLLIQIDSPLRYWMNSSSPKGYIVERLLIASQQDAEQQSTLQRKEVTGREVRYIDWVLPGILAMNMMFSCLFGIGYVVVRYRKNGVLKRLKATPLSAMEFLLAQVLSRLFIITIITIVVFVGCDIFIDFVVEGSYLLLLLIFLLGSLCMISLGLIMATRTVSEEFAGGLLNLISWPMMILSGVWFSMEGAPEPMQWIAQLLPLTHVVDASRAVMTDGAGLLDVTSQLLTLSVMTVVFLALGAYLFRWEN